MKRTLIKLFLLVFPEREDARVVRTLASDTLRKLYRPHHTDHVHTLLPFSDYHVRACVHEAKFHENEKAIQLLGGVLAHHLKNQQADALIPIPLSHKRERERGYNQVTRVAQAAHTNIKVVDTVLYKHTDTKPQTKLDRKQRLKNVKDVFAVDKRHAHKIERKHILLVDDVTTTGATLKAAKAALLPLRPASITCIALAH